MQQLMRKYLLVLIAIVLSFSGYSQLAKADAINYKPDHYLIKDQKEKSLPLGKLTLQISMFSSKIGW